MFAGKSELKKQKDGTFSNSTKSMRVENNGMQGWSYKELIFVKLLDKKGNLWTIFNTRRFSPTTTNHYRTLQDHAEKSLNFSKDRVIYLDVRTMNLLQYNDSLENIDVTYLLKNTSALNYEGTLSLVKMITNRTFSRKTEKDLIEIKDQRIKLDKEYSNESRLRKKISELKYSNPKTFKKSLTKMSCKVHLIAKNKDLIFETFKNYEEFKTYFREDIRIEEEFIRIEKLSVLYQIGT